MAPSFCKPVRFTVEEICIVVGLNFTNLGTPPTPFGAAYASVALTNSTAPTLDLRNNIFSNTQSGNTGATLRFESIGLAYSSTVGNYTGLTSNFNDLYCAGAGPGTYQIGITGTVVAGTNSTSLANWQTNTGKDANSVNILPLLP